MKMNGWSPRDKARCYRWLQKRRILTERQAQKRNIPLLIKKEFKTKQKHLHRNDLTRDLLTHGRKLIQDLEGNPKSKRLLEK
jgi:hypothetical protein